jgi:meiotically up-regulated gene 157 (Mug157) protein
MHRAFPALAWAFLVASPAAAGPAVDGLERAASCGPGWACVAAVDTPTPSAAPTAAASTPAPTPGVSFDSVRRAAAAVKLADAHEAAMFRAGLLDAGRQAAWTADGSVYVKTGDIPAEWLRDSSAQVAPYLLFAKEDPQVAAFLRGVMLRQARALARDPYANAFRADYSVWEEKFELDSLAYPILLAWTYWRVTGDATPFDADAAAGFAAALATMKAEQDHATAPRAYTHRELKGNPVGSTGMI